MFYQELKANFEEKANPEQAQQLAGYMRNQFKFYGLHTPERRKIYHDFLLREKKKKKIDWNLLNRAWEDQWWDTVDSLIKPIGDLGLRDARINELMLEWSTDSDFWVRRVAIEHQLLRKKKMNTDLLAQIIENNLNSQEFFINKAIGWALRDYPKTNSEWARQFIAENYDRMAKLSITEGSKYLYQ